MTELERLHEKVEHARKELETAEKALRKEEKRLRAQTEVIRRRASTLIRCLNSDLAIVLSTTNHYGERKVHWHNGRKGELIDGYTRAGELRWRVWLAHQSELRS